MKDDGDPPPPPIGCNLLLLCGGLFRSRSYRRSSSTGSAPRSSSRADDPSISNHHSDPVPSSAAASDIHFVKAATSPRRPPRSPLRVDPVLVTSPRLHAKPAPAARPKPPVVIHNQKPPGPIFGNGMSGELVTMVNELQRTNRRGGGLVRVSSGNAAVYGHLGNLRGTPTRSPDPIDADPNTGNPTANNKEDPVLCKALSKRFDPDDLKNMGNDEYRKGKFAEAVALYDRAIIADPGKAAYYANKAAALTGLGRLLDAAMECMEALRIDPAYKRAHHRLAMLCFRLGEADKSLHHYKLSEYESNYDDMAKVEALQTLLFRCKKYRLQGKWTALLKETQSTISAGADSAPQVFALQAEALLKLDRHDKADATLNKAPKFDVDASTKFFGATKNAFVLMIQAEVGMAAGRFEAAVRIAQSAAQVDPNNKEMSNMVMKTQVVASARSKGNDLFKASKFEDALNAYEEGLMYTPRNAILLCNRAACHSYLGQWERAIEDCNIALVVRPSYFKALLRRADCNSKLEKWEASVSDYEAFLEQVPGDKNAIKGLSKAQGKLKKKGDNRDEDTAQSKQGMPIVMSLNELTR